MMILIVVWMKGMMKDLDPCIVIPSFISYLRLRPCIFRWYLQIGKKRDGCIVRMQGGKRY